MKYVFFNTLNKHLIKYGDKFKYIWINNNDNINTQIIKHILANSKDIDGILIEDNISFDEMKISNYTDNKINLFSLKPINPNLSIKMAFFASNDTIATSFLPIINLLNLLNISNMKLFVPFMKDEGSEKVFEKQKIGCQIFSFLKIIEEKPDIFILGNDWGLEEKLIVLVCHLLGIKTVCIQESVIDFGDKKVKRMQWTDFVFVQGANSVKEFERGLYFITGNPRYEMLSYNSLPDKHKALINCNFTYGIFSNQREKWLDDIISILENLNIDYLISQHPRDNGDLSKYRNVIKSNADLVHQHISACSFLITRFSSLIHEAICLGRKVFYYNPHNERMKYDFGFDNDILFIAHNKDELDEQVRKYLNEKQYELKVNKMDRYLAIHCIDKENHPSKQIVNLLMHIKEIPKPKVKKIGVYDLIGLVKNIMKYAFNFANLRHFIHME